MTDFLPSKIRNQLKLRNMLVPDKGYILLDCDLAGADAQVVAWEAEDEVLKERFRRGARIHLENARDMYGPSKVGSNWDEENPREYWAFKTAVHGTNYGASARTTAISVGWTEAFSESFKSRWFLLHPGILDIHKRTTHLLATTKTVTNKFGYTRTFFGRNDFTNALAWIPQSTVAIVCTRGGKRILQYLPWVEILNQVHDSLVMQVPIHRFDFIKIKETLSKILENPVPYPDPLVIPWGFSFSEKSWGEKRKFPKAAEGR